MGLAVNSPVMDCCNSLRVYSVNGSSARVVFKALEVQTFLKMLLSVRVCGTGTEKYLSHGAFVTSRKNEKQPNGTT